MTSKKWLKKSFGMALEDFQILIISQRSYIIVSPWWGNQNLTKSLRTLTYLSGYYEIKRLQTML